MWAEDVGSIDYVRAQFLLSRKRVGPPPVPPPYRGRLVGWAELDPADDELADGTFHVRRTFWLSDEDRDSDPDGIWKSGCPVEAVDPRTVKPGSRGRQTARARGRIAGVAGSVIRLRP